MSDPTPATPAQSPGPAPAGQVHGHEPHLHIVPIWQLAVVLGILLVLTVVTVLVAYLTPSVTIAMAIASVKALLVVSIFMHLKWDKPFNVLVLFVSVCLLGLFLAFALMDTNYNERYRRPEYFREGWNERFTSQNPGQPLPTWDMSAHGAPEHGATPENTEHAPPSNTAGGH